MAMNTYLGKCLYHYARLQGQKQVAITAVIIKLVLVST